MFAFRCCRSVTILLTLLSVSAFCDQGVIAGPKVPPSGNPGGKSGENHGRIAAFLAALDTAGFEVREGTTGVGDPVSAVNEFFMDSCSGFNAGQYYKRFVVPSHTGDQNALDDVFKLAPDEAVVYVGKTPPRGDYFSFCAFLWARQNSAGCNPTGDWLFASVGDPLNNALIQTEGRGSPFQKNTIVILASDEGVYERIRDAAGTAGFPASMVNPLVLPSNVLRLGTEPDSDSLFVLVRSANIVSKTLETKYLADDQWAQVFRVTPRTAPVPRPFPQPAWRDRQWINEETRIPGLSAGLERLKAAILAKTDYVQARPLESVRWFYDSMDVLPDDQTLPAYRQFVAGESSDTPYRRSAENGEPTNFLLGEDEMVVVYGVNHAATGVATYSSFGVYGDWKLNHCPPLPEDPLFLYGAGERIWNGVVGMTNHDFTGSAEQYIPGDPMAPYLYAARVVRKSRAAERDRCSIIVPGLDDSRVGPPFHTDVIGLDKPVFIGYRAYLNPATGSGPAYEDVIPDRSIWFKLESPEPSLPNSNRPDIRLEGDTRNR